MTPGNVIDHDVIKERIDGLVAAIMGLGRGLVRGTGVELHDVVVAALRRT